MIDFYANLDLSKPLNLNRKTWKQAVEEEWVHSEKSDVQALKDWEKTVLREADPKYNPDSDVEETEEDWKKRLADQEAKKKEEEKKKPAAPAKKK